MAMLGGWSKIRENCFEGEMQEEITGSTQKLWCSSSPSHGIRKFRNWYSNIFKRIMLLMERGGFGGFFGEALKQKKKILYM